MYGLQCTIRGFYTARSVVVLAYPLVGSYSVAVKYAFFFKTSTAHVLYMYVHTHTYACMHTPASVRTYVHRE